VSGTLLAAFLATSALGREVDNRTVLTVVSKPVGRPAFVWGKFLGVALALTACTLVLTLVLMLVEMHGTMPTVRTPYHLPVIALGCLALLGAVAGAAWANYMYGWSFPAAATGLALPCLGIAYLVCLLFDKDWTPLAPSAQFEGRLWMAVAMMWTGLMVLAGIAVAVSTRFGQVVTLGVTFGAFLLGLMSDWLVGRRMRATADMLERLASEGNAGSALDANHLQYWGLKALYAAIPNFQVFWLSDAVQQKRDLPLDYLLPAAAYGALTVTAALCAATVLFQRRDVG
jgi:ABC-type transport system involved in multi-copper enzyme maturation permease subunit